MGLKYGGEIEIEAGTTPVRTIAAGGADYSDEIDIHE